MFHKIFLVFLVSLSNSFGVSLVFDYTYDTGNFFTAERRSVVTLAAQSFSSLAINRGAMTPGGINSWNWYVPNPSDFGEEITLANPTIGDGEIRVFLGAQNLGGGTLGQGGSVGYDASGNQAWIDLINSTNTTLAYKPFAGVISLNTTTTWYSGSDPTVTPGAFDMYSVLAHELGHVLGFGLYGGADAWTANTDALNHTFTGTAASVAYGGPLPLATDNAHIAAGTQFGGETMIMVAALPTGTRRHWTIPELESLVDLGYVAVPEPSTAYFLLGLLFVLVIQKRRVRA